jgi:cell division protein FtsA
MARQIKVGIDIGTHHTKVVIAEETRLSSPSGAVRVIPKVIGTGMAESRGVHHGYITNVAEVRESIKHAVTQAEKAAGVEVRRAFVSVGGLGLSGVTASGSVIISKADLEITQLDINKALEAAEAAIPHAVSLNKKIINTIPVEYKADGKLVWGQALGLKAQKVEVKVLFVMCLEQHLQSLIKAVEEAGIEVIDVVASPIAASFVNLSKKQKKAGSILANLGAETLSIVVYENDAPISLEVFSLGSTDITNDIALGLKVTLEEAESIKLGAVTNATFSKKKLEDIVSARLSDCFELIENHLKKIGRNALLPAGIVISGGGSGIHNIRESAESTLKLPSKIAEIHFGDEEKTKTKDGIWSVAYGLAAYGFIAEDERASIGLKGLEKIAERGKSFSKKLGDWVGQFLP